MATLIDNAKDPDNEFARSEFYQMSHQAELDRTLKVTWWEMFAKPAYRKRTALAMGFAFIGYVVHPHLCDRSPFLRSYGRT